MPNWTLRFCCVLVLAWFSPASLAQETVAKPSPPQWFARALAGAKPTGCAIVIIIPDAAPEREWDTVQDLASFKGEKLESHPKLKLALQKLEKLEKLGQRRRLRFVIRRSIALSSSRLRTIKNYKWYEEQDEVAFAIELLHHTEDIGQKETLMLVPMICARASWIEAKPSENLVLVDPSGERLAGQGVDLCFAADVQRGVLGLLRKDGRLQKLAEKQDTAQFRKLVADLLSGDRKAESAARKALVDGYPDHAAAMAVARREAGSDSRENALAGVIRVAFGRKHQFPAGAVIGNKPGPPETLGRHIGRANRIMLRFHTDR